MNFQSTEHFTNLFKRSPKTLPTIPPDISQTSADCRAVSNVADIFRTFCRHSANCGCNFLNICRQVHRHVRRKIENSSAPYFLGDESEITAILAMFLASTIISSILQRVTKRMTRTCPHTLPIFMIWCKARSSVPTSAANSNNYDSRDVGG